MCYFHCNDYRSIVFYYLDINNFIVVHANNSSKIILCKSDYFFFKALAKARCLFVSRNLTTAPFKNAFWNLFLKKWSLCLCVKFFMFSRLSKTIQPIKFKVAYTTVNIKWFTLRSNIQNNLTLPAMSKRSKFNSVNVFNM